MKLLAPGTQPAPTVRTTASTPASPRPPLKAPDSTFNPLPVRTSNAARPAGGPVDVTARFGELYAKAKDGELSLPKDSKQYVYLMVPGYMAPKGAMKPNQAALKKLGLDARLATEGKGRIDVKDDVQANAAALAKMIRKIHADTGKLVVPMVHSSGAPELHAALIADPGLKDLLRCAVTLSGTFGGTPLAAPYEKLPAKVQDGIEWLADKVGVDTDGISDVSECNRQALLKQHPYPSDLLTFSVATSVEDGFSLLRPLQKLIGHVRDGAQSDGMVPTLNQALAGQPVAYLPDADHRDTIMDRRLNKQEPEALTIAALAYALGAANDKAAPAPEPRPAPRVVSKAGRAAV